MVLKRKDRVQTKFGGVAGGSMHPQKVQVPKLLLQNKRPGDAAGKTAVVESQSDTDEKVLTRSQLKQQKLSQQNNDPGNVTMKQNLAGIPENQDKCDAAAGTATITKSVPKPIPDFLDRFPKDLAVDYDLIASVDRMNRDLAKMYDQKMNQIFNPVFDDVQEEQEEEENTHQNNTTTQQKNKQDQISAVFVKQRNQTGIGSQTSKGGQVLEENFSFDEENTGLSSDTTSQQLQIKVCDSLKITDNKKTVKQTKTTKITGGRSVRKQPAEQQKVGRTKQTRKRKLDQQNAWNNSEQVPVYLDVKKAKKVETEVLDGQNKNPTQIQTKKSLQQQGQIQKQGQGSKTSYQQKPKQQKKGQISKKDGDLLDGKQFQQLQKQLSDLQEELNQKNHKNKELQEVVSQKNKEIQDIQSSKNQEVSELKEIIGQKNREISILKSKESQMNREVQVLKEENKSVKYQKSEWEKGRQISLRKAQQLADLSNELANELKHLKKCS